MTAWPKHLHGRIKRLYAEDDYLWCQESNAQNTEGYACQWSDDNVAEFCLLGAVYKVYHGSRHWPVVSVYLAQVMGSAFWEGPLLGWNDNPERTYKQVLAFLDKHKL